MRGSAAGGARGPRGRAGRAALAAAAVSAAACLAPMGPDYRRPALNLPARHRDTVEARDARTLADLPWWEIFADPVLGALIDEAITGNLGLREAAARVEQAREQASAAGAALWPGISLGLQGSRRHGQTTAPLAAGGTPGTTSFFSGSLQATWELDLWGRLRRAREAQVAQFLATEEAQRGVLVSLVAEVAGAYFVLVQLDEQLEIAQQTASNYQHTRDLYAARLAGGTSNRVPVATGDAQLQDARSTAINIGRQIVAQENAICLLLGRAPGPVRRRGRLQAHAEVPKVPPGLPSALLERRPDVRQAEQVLVQANALVGVATGSLMPSFSLTALAGLASTHLGRLLSLPALVWQGGGQAGILAPVVQGAALRRQLAAARAAQRAAHAAYEGAVVRALADVATALNDTNVLREVAAARQGQVDALSEALALAVDRYRGGVTSFLEVTTTQNSLFPARLDLVATKARQHVALVSLYKALGGGWAQPRPAADARPTP